MTDYRMNKRILEVIGEGENNGRKEMVRKSELGGEVESRREREGGGGGGGGRGGERGGVGLALTNTSKHKKCIHCSKKMKH